MEETLNLRRFTTVLDLNLYSGKNMRDSFTNAVDSLPKCTLKNYLNNKSINNIEELNSAVTDKSSPFPKDYVGLFNRAIKNTNHEDRFTKLLSYLRESEYWETRLELLWTSAYFLLKIYLSALFLFINGVFPAKVVSDSIDDLYIDIPELTQIVLKFFSILNKAPIIWTAVLMFLVILFLLIINKKIVNIGILSLPVIGKLLLNEYKLIYLKKLKRLVRLGIPPTQAVTMLSGAEYINEYGDMNLAGRKEKAKRESDEPAKPDFVSDYLWKLIYTGEEEIKISNHIQSSIKIIENYNPKLVLFFESWLRPVGFIIFNTFVLFTIWLVFLPFYQLMAPM